MKRAQALVAILKRQQLGEIDWNYITTLVLQSFDSVRFEIEGAECQLKESVIKAAVAWRKGGVTNASTHLARLAGDVNKLLAATRPKEQPAYKATSETTTNEYNHEDARDRENEERAAAIEATWKERQGDEYGSY